MRSTIDALKLVVAKVKSDPALADRMSDTVDLVDEIGFDSIEMLQLMLEIEASLAIRNVLRYPDVLGVEEMENLPTLQALANKVNSDAATAGDSAISSSIVSGSHPMTTTRQRAPTRCSHAITASGVSVCASATSATSPSAACSWARSASIA